MQAPDFRNKDLLPGHSSLPRGRYATEDALWEPLDRPFRPPVHERPRDVIRAVRPRWWVHIALFAATAFTCWTVGGLWYAVGIMGFLFAHEMGHFVASLRWGVRASLPYFIPFPTIPYVVASPFGTLGAVIVMKSRIPNRRALLDIGVAGPIAGFVVALVAITVGMWQSQVISVPESWIRPGSYIFGESLLMLGMKYLMFGPLPDDAILIMSPLARAGWVGLFVTALNLLPIGQLDGGHIAYTLFRRHYYLITIIATAILIALVYVSIVWLLFAVLALLYGRKHPPPIDDITPLDARRRRIGYLCIAILVLCFMPNPLQIAGF